MGGYSLNWFDTTALGIYGIYKPAYMKSLIKLKCFGLGFMNYEALQLTDNFGPSKLASWKYMTLRLVGYFTNLGKTIRLAVLSHSRDSEASTCSEFEL